MTIEEKYKIQYINEKRYYQVDIAEKLLILDETIPFLFKYKNIEIYESSWNKMALGIVTELDRLYPKNEEWFLGLSYWWSKTEVFSKVKRTNFTPYKNIFLNTNHNSTHSMMSIQCILMAFGVDLQECLFLIRRHPSSEPAEAREYFRNKTILAFRNSMIFRGFSNDGIDMAVKNVNAINKILDEIRSGYNDFFLFDDYYYFTNYKSKVMKRVKETFDSPKKVAIIEKTLNCLDEYYKNKRFYESIESINISPSLKDLIGDEIESLFNQLNDSVIVSSKLYAKMSFDYPDEMRSLGKLNNESDLYILARCYYSGRYFFEDHFISKENSSCLTNDQIIIHHIYSQDDININKLNSFISKMHLKKPNNYLSLMIECSDDFVQVDIDRMIRKDKMDISEEHIQKIRNELYYYIASFGPIISKTYVGYPSLPSLKFQWNKYLLVGIIRSYLKNEFSIRYEGNTYKAMEYIINLM